ncbi:ATP-binding protein [Chryseobacterium limigenitum]
MENADKKLSYYEKNISYAKLPITAIHIHFFRGVIASSNGTQNSAKDEFEKSIQIINTNKLEKKYFLNSFNFYANSLIRIGNYEKALGILFEILEVKEFKVRFPVYNSIGVCYYNLKQFDKAEYYYQLSVQNSDDANKAQLSCNLALLLIEQKKSKEAEKYINRLDFKKLTSIDSSFVFNVLSEIEKRNKNYSKAIDHINTVIRIDERLDNKASLGSDYLSIGSLYKETGNLKQADFYFNKSYQLLNQFEDKNSKKLLLENLIGLELLKNNNPNGTRYFGEFLRISDSINSEAIQKSTNALNLKFETSKKESQIKTQQLQIEKQKNNTNMALMGIALMSLLSVGGYAWIRARQKQKQHLMEKQIEEFEYDISKLELSNINNQLNPHEIAGILQRVGLEIYSESSEAYQTMTKLHRIIRPSLTTTLTENFQLQLEQIENLLSFEQSKINIPFDYSIQNQIQNTEIAVPKLLLVNLVNNAINHGIRKNQPHGGNITVNVKEDSDYHYFTVEDTGKGRDISQPLQKGLGLSSYEKLFFVLNKKNTLKASLEIIDKIPQTGTIIKVKIPKNYQYTIN